MRSTRSQKAVNAAPNSSLQPKSAPAASQKKKPRAVRLRKRVRHNSDDSDLDDSAEDTNNTRAQDPSPVITQSISNSTQPHSSLLDISSDDTNELPTVENYNTEEMMKRWTPSRCKERLSLKFKGRASKDGKEEIKALIRKYEHLKMMMALALRCSLRTVNKQVAAPKKQGQSAYLYFRIFGKQSHTDPMPHPDDDDITEKLGSYNRATGDNWSELNADQKAIFEHSMLLALAGVPDLAADHVEDDDDDQAQGDTEVLVPEVTQRTEEEEARYRPIYDELVNHDKVVARFGVSIPGMTDATFTRRSLRCIQKYQRDLIADSHRHEFDFWLVASSSVPPLQPGTLTWCKVTTTLPVMTKWVTQKANFPTIFGAVSQGTSLIQAVSQATGSHVIKSQPRKNKSDCEKVALGQELVRLLTATIGEKPRGLPRGPNIDKSLASRKDKPVRIVQLPGSTLTAEDLAKGFVEMNAAGRRRWQHDIDANLFQFQLIHKDKDACRETEDGRPVDDEIDESSRGNGDDEDSGGEKARGSADEDSDGGGEEVGI
ncbi:uncharacterized protein MELLADRAFT_60252 [Melampsora larici-populina 98AG31]|uniref:Uncharacterized protein n=1 Tax=Melampsora larici-populina (strain 98AG31 / pathotype 3-4-7) TaxID=747676 RepID=F4RAN0_MELLP|nr:uncharacterized protein MELLADRAFT_60252 [Melampsora larici-populina 98AG31]EGG10755.1 hypothetical protein MELLADRAFT_60252 [Melampsora larici-populina 98AG31]